VKGKQVLITVAACDLRDRQTLTPLLGAGFKRRPSHAVGDTLVAAVVDVLLVDVARAHKDSVFGLAIRDNRHVGHKLIAISGGAISSEW
jgi:hypothetical protein